MLDVRNAQTTLEDALRDAILYALGKRQVTAADVAGLRAATSQGETGSKRTDDDLAVIVVADVVTASFRWRQSSTAADNGTTVIRPDDVDAGAPGRWLSWSSPLRFAPTVGGDSKALHEFATGVLERVIVIDRKLEMAEINGLIAGQVPSVLIEAGGDAPEDATQNAGDRWDESYTFDVTVITENLRGRRQAAQGSTLDSTIGGNQIDGWIWSLLGGPQLQLAVEGIREIRVGQGENWASLQVMRRVMRARSYVVRATVVNPAAPNDAGALEAVNVQKDLAELGDDAGSAFDPDNCITAGLGVPLGSGLTQAVAAGTAVIAGEAVVYAGELKTFAAWTDTYRDLAPDGVLVFVEAGWDEAPASPAAGNLRIGCTRTDDSQILSDRLTAPSKIPFGNPWTVPLE